MKPSRNAIPLALVEGHVSGWLDAAEFGQKGYASYALAGDFGGRDFPISFVFPLGEDVSCLRLSHISFLCRFDNAGDGLRLRRPGSPALLATAVSSGSNVYCCKDSGEYVAPFQNMRTFRDSDGVRYSFQTAATYPIYPTYITLPDGMVLYVSVTSTKVTLSTPSVSSGYPRYYCELNYSMGDIVSSGRIYRTVSGTEYDIVSFTVTSTGVMTRIVVRRYYSQTNYYEENISLIFDDDEDIYHLQCAPINEPTEDIYYEPSTTINSMSVSRGLGPAKTISVEKLSNHLAKTTDETGEINYLSFFSDSSPQKAMLGSVSYRGQATGYRRVAMGRPSMSADKFFFDTRGSECRSLIADSFFINGLSAYATTETVSTVSDSAVGAPSLLSVGTNWVKINSYCTIIPTLSSLPRPGVSYIIALLCYKKTTSSSFGSGTFHIEISGQYRDGTAVAAPSVYFYDDTLPKGSLFPLVAPLCFDKELASLTLTMVGAFGGEIFIKSFSLFSGADVRVSNYASNSEQDPSSTSSGLSVGFRVSDSLGRDFYGYGPLAAGAKRFYRESSDSILSMVGDHGEKTTATFTSMGATHNTFPAWGVYAATATRLTSPDGLIQREFRGYEQSTWRINSKKIDEVETSYSLSYRGQPTNVSIPPRNSHYTYDIKGRLSSFYHAFGTSTTPVNFTYYNGQLTSVSYDSYSIAISYDNYGRTSSWSTGTTTMGQLQYENNWKQYLTSSSSFSRSTSYDYETDGMPDSFDDGEHVFSFSYPTGPELPVISSPNFYSEQLSRTVEGNMTLAKSITNVMVHWSKRKRDASSIGAATSEFAYNKISNLNPIYRGDWKTWTHALWQEQFWATAEWEDNGELDAKKCDGSETFLGLSMNQMSLDQNHVYCAAATNHSMVASATSFTFSMCVYFTATQVSSGSFPLFAAINPSDSTALSLTLSSGKIVTTLGGSDLTSIQVNEGWNAIGITVSSNSVSLCVNGTLQSVSSASWMGTLTLFSLALNGAAPVSFLAWKASSVDSKKLRSIVLLSLDCVMPRIALSQSGSLQCVATSDTHFSLGLSSYGAFRIPLSGGYEGDPAISPSHLELPSGVGDYSLSGGFPVARPSAFEYVPDAKAVFLRCYGQRVSYPLGDGLQHTIRLLVYLRHTQQKRTLFTISDGTNEFSIVAESNRTVHIYHGNSSASTGARLKKGLNDLRLSFQLNTNRTLLTAVAYEGTNTGNSTQYLNLTGGGTGPLVLNIGNNLAGNLPANCLIGDVVCHRFAVTSSAMALDLALITKRTFELREGADDFGRLAFSEITSQGTEIVSSHHTYLSYNNVVTKLLTSEVLTAPGYSKTIAHSYSSGVLSSYDGQAVSYDAAGQLLQAMGQSMTYDGLGNILTMTRGGSTLTFSYQTSGFPNRLWKISYPGGKTRTYVYPSGGAMPSSVNVLTPNPSGLPTIDSLDLAYSHGRLSSATRNSATVTYQYGPDGCLCLRTKGSDVRRYVFGGDGRLSCVRLSSGQALFYEYGPSGRLAAVVHRVSSSESHAYAALTDCFGRILRLVGIDVSGYASYSYDVWGKPSLTADTTSAGIGTLNRVLYKGYLYDDDLGMYCLGHRHYDPEAGRFIEPDLPWNLTHDTPSGLNPYVYCLNDPIHFSDPTGKLPQVANWIIGGIVIAAAIALCAVAGVAAAPILAGAFACALTSSVVSGLKIDKRGRASWDWENASEGFCWGAVSGAISGAIGIGVGEFVGMSAMTDATARMFQFFINGATAYELEKTHALVHNEQWDENYGVWTMVSAGALSCFDIKRPKKKYIRLAKMWNKVIHPGIQGIASGGLPWLYSETKD